MTNEQMLEQMKLVITPKTRAYLENTLEPKYLGEYLNNLNQVVFSEPEHYSEMLFQIIDMFEKEGFIFDEIKKGGEALILKFSELSIYKKGIILDINNEEGLALMKIPDIEDYNFSFNRIKEEYIKFFDSFLTVHQK